MSSAFDTAKAIFAGRHRIESRILVTFLALAAAAFGLAKLGGEVAEGDTFAIDKAILTGLRTASDPSVPITPDWFTQSMVDVTALGGVTVLTLVTIFAVGYLVATQRNRVALFVAASVGGGALATTLLKQLYTRARPEVVPHLVQVDTASFPSGHAMNSALVYLTLAVLVARTQSRTWVRIYLISSAILLTLIVGFSRVFLGVHWPSDVLAGWGVGSVWAVFSTLTAKLLQQRRQL